MSVLLVTGGAGFIGSNFVRHALAHTADRLIIVDSLTYAGSLLNLAPALGDPRVRSSTPTSPIAPRWRVCSTSSAPDAVVNLAAETHVDRSIDGPRPSSTPTSSARSCCSRRRARLAARDAAARRTASGSCTCRPTRCTARSGPRARSPRTRPTRRTRRTPRARRLGRSSGPRLLSHLRPAGAHHQLLEQLRAVPVSREADPADDAQRARRPAAADLRRRRQRAGLAARRGPLRGPAAWCCGAGRPGEKYNIGGASERTNLDVVDRSATRSRRAARGVEPGARARRWPTRPQDVRRRPAGARSALRDRRREDSPRARLDARA